MYPYPEEEQKQEMERKKKEILRKIMDKGAIERLGRVRVANQNMAEQLEAYLIQLYQMGQIQDTITEDRLKHILGQMKNKKEWRIKRK